MGCAFGFNCDNTMKALFKWLWRDGYIRNLKENLKDLTRQMEDLKAIEVEVKNKVEIAERLHLQMRSAVGVWLTRMEDVRTRFNDLDSTSTAQLKNLFLCNSCLTNVYSSYNYGKSVFLMLEEVKTLKSEGVFGEVVMTASRSVVEKRPTRPTVGQEEMLEKAWNRIMVDGVGIMGLHGMGGVGKTTLFKKIHIRFAEKPASFDIVIWVVVSQGAKISKLQDDIAQKRPQKMDAK